MAAATFTYPIDLTTATAVSGVHIQTDQNTLRDFVLGANLTGENLSTAASITGSQIGTGEVGASNVGANALGASQLAAYSFPEQCFGDGAVTEPKIDYTTACVMRTGAAQIGVVRGRTAFSVASGASSGSCNPYYLTDGINPLRNGFSELPQVGWSVEATANPAGASGACAYSVTYNPGLSAIQFTIHTSENVTATWSGYLHWLAMGPMA